MRCVKIRNLLAADYIDGELDDDTRKEVERHIESCSRCKLYKETVRHAAIEPFRNARRYSTPDRVWSEIKLQIQKKPEEVLLKAPRGPWQNLFGIRKAAFAMATAAAVIVIAVVLFREPSVPTTGTQPTAYDTAEVQEYIREQFIALSYLGRESAAEGGNGYFGIASVDFGTAVEEYLL